MNNEPMINELMIDKVDLTEQELDSVSGGRTDIQIGPIHMSFGPGWFGFGVGNSGAWIDAGAGSVCGHLGGSGGCIGGG